MASRLRRRTSAATVPAPPRDPDFLPVQLHCAHALESDFTPTEQMDRAKVVMQAAPRMPAVAFFGGRYGEHWYVDIVALPHNAVRRQLYDAFTIANALGKMTLDIADADLARVYAWLGTLERFVHATMYAEDRFLYPLIDAAVKKAKTPSGNPVRLPPLLAQRARQDAKHQIKDLLSTARKTRDVATGETTAKINALRYALDQFGANVLDYYSEMEHFVPKLLKKALRNGEKEKTKFEKNLFQQLVSEPHGGMLAALLMQCIESRAKRTDFLDRVVKKDKERTMFRAHIKKVEGTHMLLSRTFDSVSNRYERRFGVSTFLEHYGANVDANETLQMLGDIDLNAEDDDTPRELDSPLAPAPASNIYDDISDSDHDNGANRDADSLASLTDDDDDDGYVEVITQVY